MLESLDLLMLRAQYALPAALVASMPALSYQLSRQPHCVQQNFDRFLLTKLTVATCLFATKLLYVYNLYTAGRTASAIDLASIVEVFCLIWLFYLQHTHSPTPLAFLSIYLTLDIVFKAAALWISDRRTSVLGGFECLLVESFYIKMVLLVLHEQSTWNTMKRQFKLKLGREATYGFWSRVFGIPLTSSLLRAQNWTAPQMGELDDTPISKELEASFYDAWHRYGEAQYGLLRSCAATMVWPVGFTILAKGLVIAITMVIPFWIAFIVHVAEEHIQSDSNDPRHAHLQTTVVIGSFAVFLLRMVLQTVMRHSETCITLNIRSILTMACFKKLHSLAEGTIAKHARLSLISRNITSLENNTDFFFLMNQGVVECVLTSIFLWQDFGYVTTAALLVTPYVAYRIIDRYEGDVTAARAALLKKQEDRTNAATVALNSIKSGKVTGNGRIQATIVERLRAEEVQARKALEDALWVSHHLSILMHSALPLFALAGNYYWIGGKFSVAAVIKNLMFLCRYMKSSMYAFKWSQRVVQWLECWTRIEDFLRIPDDIAEPMAAEVPRKLQHDDNAVVRATAASIAPETNRQPCVKNASFVLSRDTITVLTGDVATGKSTLLLAMLGQSNVVSGSLLVNEDSISYCGQDSWVQNISIQDNIVGDSGFEQQWYDEVVDACLLRSEVDRLPGGSQYVVGTRGAKLDRAQRQRLALARSVYSRARLTLLDDVLSSQSSIAAQHLVVNLFSKDGLLNRDRTVFTTAKIWIPFARAECKFMTINAAGTVSRVNLDNLIDTIPPENTDRDFTEQLAEDPYVNHSSHTIACNELDSEVRFGKASGAGTKRASLNVLFDSVDTFTVMKGIALLTITLILEVSSVLLFRPWLASKGQNSFSYLLSFLLLVAAPFAWGISASILRNEVSEKISDVFHERLTHAIFNAPYSFFTTENTSTALNMLCETFRTFSVDAYMQGMQLPYHIIDACVAFSFICLGHAGLIPLFLTILAVTYLLLELQYKILNPLVQAANLAEFELRAHFAETASGSAHIRAMNWRRRHVARTNFLINQSQKARHHVAMYTELSNTVLDLAGVFWLVLFIWFCVRWQVTPYHIGLGCFEICQVLYIMPWTVQFWNVFNNNLATVTEMNDFIESVPKEVHGPFKPPPANWPTAGRIVMRDAYIGYDVDGANPVLRNVQFTIAGNRETGFFGHAESGKTSLLLALCRGTHYKGSITLDGVEIRDVGPDVLKRLITIVPEQPTVFYGTTIRQALLPYEIVNPPIGGPGILRAFDRVLYNIGLLDMVNAVGGLEAPMEKLKLSPEQLLLFGVGQSLMTFFLDRSPIILIDSVLSRVSSKTFKMMRLMKNDIFKMFEGTVILTSDYPSVVWDSDKMGRIRNGSVSVMEKRALPQGSSRS